MKKIALVVLLFFFTLSLRIWNINSIGRTWDESAQVVDGYHFIELAKKGNFSDAYWYDHPYHPPLTKYIYGIASYFDIETGSMNKKPIYKSPEPNFKYELTVSRFVSALFSSLSVIFIVLIGLEYFTVFMAIISAVVFAMLPFFLGLSQASSIESILMFSFTGSVYFFIKFLKTNSRLFMFVAGAALGLALLTKYTNALLFPILIVIYIVWNLFEKKKTQKFLFLHVIYIFLIGLIIFYLLWPMPFLHLQEFINLNYKLRITDSAYSVPEVFFGKLILVPKTYYIVHFLITTPLIVLFLFILGVMKGVRKNNWIYFSLLLWFVIPFFQSLYNFRQHGVRYIIEIYAPLSLLAGIGAQYISERFNSQTIAKLFVLFAVSIYLFVILIRVSPYYFDYFNETVGGTKGVYEKRLFQLGWWGEGIAEAGRYLNRVVPKNSSVGLAVAPIGVMPPGNYVAEEYQFGKEYDYVLVSYFHIVRHGFDDSEVRKNYRPIYYVRAAGAPIIIVYKNKKI